MLDQNTNSKIKGYMPRTNSEGFVFTKGMTVEDIAETMTHELCHGLYGLEHTFIKSYGLTEGSTNNLMDYTTKTPDDFLSYHEWCQINQPVMSWSLFNSDEDAMWTTDGHFYLFDYLCLLMGLDEKTAFKE